MDGIILSKGMYEVGPIDMKLAKSGDTTAFTALVDRHRMSLYRVANGKEKHLDCLKEVYRILMPGGILSFCGPMHLNIAMPGNMEPYVTSE